MPLLRHAATQTQFVYREANRLMLNGRIFRAIGTNMYNAAMDPGTFSGGPYMSDPTSETAGLPYWFREAVASLGATVVRVWFTQPYAGALRNNFTGLDRVVNTAERFGLKIIAVLGNAGGALDDNHNGTADDTAYTTLNPSIGQRLKDAAWFSTHYKQPYGDNIIPYALPATDADSWVKRVVTRYAQRKGIMCWELGNEFESCVHGDISTPAAAALLTFVTDVSAYIKRLDPNHLIATGVIGTGQNGVAGTNYEALHGVSSVDLCTLHNYPADPAVAIAGLYAPPLSALATSAKALDQNWAEVGAVSATNQARTWQQYSYTIPSSGAGSAQPMRFVGLEFNGFAGDIYIDNFTVGATTVNFEDASVHGFSGANLTACTAAIATNPVYAGAKSLKITTVQTSPRCLAWTDDASLLAAATPGTTISARVWVDTNGVEYQESTPGAAIIKARLLNKPLLIEEYGLLQSSFSAAQRATYFADWLSKFVDQGVAAALQWDWHPGYEGGWEIYPGDPSNAILLAQASRI